MKAAEMLTPNDAIIIASGTTVLAFARCIPPEAQLTVLTSAMNVAMALLNCQQVEVIQLGGIVRHTSSSVTGEYALRMLENFSGTKLFLGVDGIDLKYGLTTTNFMGVWKDLRTGCCRPDYHRFRRISQSGPGIRGVGD